MTRVLVTGAGGFLGTHLCAALKTTGAYVIGVDHHSPPYDQYATDIFYVRDLRDYAQAQSVVSHVEQVYDLAASLGGVEYLEGHQSEMWATNLRINLNVLEAAASVGARYLFPSSGCVYPLGHDAYAEPLREDTAWPAQPSEGAYGMAKLAHEQACVYFRDCGIETRIARLFNTYGPYGDWQGGREKSPAALCRKVAEAVRDGRDSIAVFGDGQQRRSYCYVADTVRGLIALMNSDETRPVNLGSDQDVTIDELARHAMDAAGAWFRIEHVPGPQGVRSRHADTLRARQSLGWAPSVPLAEGIGHLYRWVSEQVGAGVPA